MPVITGKSELLSDFPGCRIASRPSSAQDSTAQGSFPRATEMNYVYADRPNVVLRRALPSRLPKKKKKRIFGSGHSSVWIFRVLLWRRRICH